MPQTGWLRWAGLLAVLVAGVILANRAAAGASGWVPHLVSHLSAGLALAALAAAAVRWRPGQSLGISPAGRAGSYVAISGLIMASLGQLVESASAVIEYPGSGSLHAGSATGTLLGILVLVLGMVVLVGAAWRGGLLSGWAVLLVPMAGLALFTAITGFHPEVGVVLAVGTVLMVFPAMRRRRRE